MPLWFAANFSHNRSTIWIEKIYLPRPFAAGFLMEIDLTYFSEDPIFSDRQQRTFSDLFWLSNHWWELIVETWIGLIPSSRSKSRFNEERSL